ncbi:MAG: DUF192 domain-containing protein [Vicinamibacteria bacterium]|jgi:hypothetical protein|nr:DUF192 domain-containing protein [Vicinamibacteria bacterium]
MRASAYLALGLLVASAAVAGDAPATTKLTLPSGQVVTAELMISAADRQMGLMFRPALPADRVLLFVFRENDRHSIWMKNCKFPIDIVWLDGDGKVVDLAENVPPCAKDPCPVYTPFRAAEYVVEMNAGQAKKHKVQGGAVLGFRLPAER